MEEDLRGIPSKMWFCLNLKTLSSKLEAIGSALASTVMEITKPVVKAAKKVEVKAVEIGKEFTSQNEQKPMATYTEYKALVIQ